MHFPPVGSPCLSPPPHSVAVLLFNTSQRSLVLVRQFRPGEPNRREGQVIPVVRGSGAQGTGEAWPAGGGNQVSSVGTGGHPRRTLTNPPSGQLCMQARWSATSQDLWLWGRMLPGHCPACLALWE